MLRYKVIKNQLVTEIAGMNVNDRLPSRLELCKRLDTTRMTIDKAIKELVTEGVLFSKQGDGTFVAAAKEEEFIHKGNWGVIVPDVSEGFFAKIVRGVENVAQKYGVNVVLCNTDYDFAKQEQYIKRLDYSGISGLIVVPIVSRDIQENYNLYNQLNELNIPFVFCNSNAEGVNAPVVTSNNFYGGYIATKHLLEKGYRNIAYISKEKLRENVERCQGYITALSENGIEVNHNTIIFENKSQVQCPGYESMKKLITFDKKVDAVFCNSDKAIPGVYKAIFEAGLRVSDDIGVIGYDNTEICEKSTPKITSIDFKNLEIGTKAAEVLCQLYNKEDLSNFSYFLFQPEIVIRDSCLGLGMITTTR